VDATVLGPALKREIAYRVLRGPRRETFFAMLDRKGHAAQMHAILRRLHLRYAKPLNVSRLGRRSGWSVSALHDHFKAMTSTSSVHYVKAIRLQKSQPGLVAKLRLKSFMRHAAPATHEKG
jgi:transcriptional regulator GlxA family with amidase domain